MDSSKPEFWDQCYQNKNMRWDLGGAPVDFKKHIGTFTSPLRILIPGCGSGYEAQLAAEMGWNVTAIDFSRLAIERAATILGEWKSVLKQADFFTLNGSFDAMYERAFLAAIPPHLRVAYADKAKELVVSGGQLFGYFLVGDRATQGPPYSILDAELSELLSPEFERIFDVSSKDPVDIFGGKERFQIWKRQVR